MTTQVSLSGLQTGQTTSQDAPINPFASTTIADQQTGATETLTITLSGAGGTLADGAGYSGLVANADGTYTLSGSAFGVTAELQALVFTPTAGAAGTQSTTSFALNDLSTPTASILVSFNGLDGKYPLGSPSAYDGGLIVATTGGGSHAEGTVFLYDPSPAAPRFGSLPGGLTINYHDSLILGSNGILYALGSASGGKLIFLINIDQNLNITYNNLNISANGSSFIYADGSLALASDGKFVATAAGGGSQGNFGGIFQVDPATDAAAAIAEFDGTNGANPTGSLLVDAAGDLFGLASAGGANGDGTIFEVTHTALGYGSLVALASFDGTNGATPYGSLIADAAGDLFGTTSAGGDSGKGTVFELVKTATGYGPLVTLASFNGANGDHPNDSLIFDAAGDLVGTTVEGGANGNGTVFALPNNGSGYGPLVTLLSFNGANGAYPYGNLLVNTIGQVPGAPLGALIGTTAGGGTYGLGAVFELSGSAIASATGTASVVNTDAGLPLITIVSQGGPTNKPSQAIFGSANIADAGKTVTVSEGSVPMGWATIDGTGTWSTVVYLTGDGVHTLTASEALSPGVVGLGTSVTYTLDTVAPAAPADLADTAIIGGLVGPAGDTLAQTLTGTAEAGATITISDGAQVLGTTTADMTGAWSFVLGVLPDGSTHSLTATATDAAGNVSAASSTLSFTVNLAPTLADASIVNGYVNKVNDTATQTLTGFAVAGSVVTVYRNGKKLGLATVDPSSGAWTYKLGVLANGHDTLTVVAVDAAGHSRTSAPLTFTVLAANVAAPSKLADTAIVTNIVNAPRNTSAQTVTGFATVGTTVTVLDNGVALGTAAVALPASGTLGKWSYTPGPLPDGPHSLTAVATDVAGNTSLASKALSFTVNTLAPDMPTTLADAADINDYVNAKTDLSNQRLTGFADPGSVITIYNDGVRMGSVKVPISSGAWSYALGVLANGHYDLTAVSTNALGNVSAPSDPLSFTVDTVVPHPTITDIVYDPNGGIATLTGTTKPYQYVTISDASNSFGAFQADGNGLWTDVIDASAPAKHAIVLSTTDTAGNVGLTAGVALFDSAQGVTLVGGKGNDLLFGAPGDTLTGGAGADTFVFHDGFGIETVTDFTSGTDALRFSQSVFADWAHLLAATTQNGTNLVITADAADVITLKNVTLASFKTANVQFV